MVTMTFIDIPVTYVIFYESLKGYEKHIDNKGTYGDFNWTFYNRMVPANGGFTPQLNGNFKNHNEILNHWILAISSYFQTHPFTNYTKIVVEYGRMAVARFEPSHFDFDVGGPPSHLLWAVALYVQPNPAIPQVGVTWNLWNLDDPNISFGISGSKLAHSFRGRAAWKDPWPLGLSAAKLVECGILGERAWETWGGRHDRAQDDDDDVHVGLQVLSAADTRHPGQRRPTKQPCVSQDELQMNLPLKPTNPYEKLPRVTLLRCSCCAEFGKEFISKRQTSAMQCGNLGRPVA